MMITVAHSLANESIRQYTEFEEFERSPLLARQAYLYNGRYRGNAAREIDAALHTVLSGCLVVSLSSTLCFYRVAFHR